jgi:hypothetical protein
MKAALARDCVHVPLTPTFGRDRDSVARSVEAHPTHLHRRHVVFDVLLLLADVF